MTSSDFIMIINNAEINKKLIGKLKEDSIEEADIAANKCFRKQKLDVDIITKSKCGYCNLCNDKTNYILPYGNVMSDIMFIYEPTEVDSQTHVIMFDEYGRFFTSLIKSLGLKKDNVYVTTNTKCYTKSENDFSCSSMLLREIEIIRPKIIITLGKNSMDMIRGLSELSKMNNILEGRRKCYNVNIDNINFKLYHTLSPTEFLTKPKTIYSDYKTKIWSDIKEILENNK